MTIIKSQCRQLYFQVSPKINALIRRATAETSPSFHLTVIALTAFRYIISLTARNVSLFHHRTFATATADKIRVNKLDGTCGYPTCSDRVDWGRLQQIKCHCTHLQLKRNKSNNLHVR